MAGTDVVQGFLRCIEHLFPVDERTMHEFLCFTEEDIFGNRDTRHRTALLNDHADAVQQSVCHRGRIPGCAVEQHFSAVTVLHPGIDGGSGRFSGPVLSDQSQHFAAESFEADIVQCHRRPKPLRHVFDLNYWIHREIPSDKLFLIIILNISAKMKIVRIVHFY